MNKFHQQILEEFKKQPQQPSKHRGTKNYIGTKSFEYHIPNPIKREIAKIWAGKNKNISSQDFIELLDSLNKGNSHEEKSFVGMLLEQFPGLRKLIQPKDVDKWLNNVCGWAEVDSFCQNIFPHEEILANWRLWKKVIHDFSKDNNIHKKRAGLVLLTGPVNYSSDIRLADLAFENIDALKSEKDILTTKAISWLLRRLIKYHRKRVEDYLQQNENILPRITIRETKRKMLTGKK